MVTLASLLDREPLASRDVLAELDDAPDDGAAVFVLADRRALEVQRARFGLRRSFEAPTVFGEVLS